MPSGSRKEGDGDFLLIVSAQPRYAPFLVGWQEFKDDVRKVVKEQPGWTDTCVGRRGEMQGWCKLKDGEDAESAYKDYSRAKGIMAHVFQTCGKTDAYRLWKCNCSSHFPDIAERGHSPKRSGLDIGNVNQVAGKKCAVSAPQYNVAVPPAYPYTVYTQAPTYTRPAYAIPGPASAPIARQVPPSAPAPVPVASRPPVYLSNAGGFPVNIRDGAVLTEARSIFISNLSYQAGPDDLNALLYTVGRPVESKMHRDTRTGLFKGVATAKFASKEEAQFAAAHLNRKQHMGMTLNVRMDTDTTIVGQVGPVIVNGSNTYNY